MTGRFALHGADRSVQILELYMLKSKVERLSDLQVAA
jgi:hypothetical protein